MAQKVIVPQKKNYIPQFLKQRDINGYFVFTLRSFRDRSRTNQSGYLLHNKGQKLMEIPFLPDPSDLLGEYFSLGHQPPEQRTIP